MPPRDEPTPIESALEPPAVPLFDIFWLFCRISSLSFGGGVTAWIFREVVEQKKWLSQTDFLSALTLAQVLPGVNTVNMAVYIGQRLRGLAGSVAAVLGLIAVPFFAVIALASAYAAIQTVPTIQHVLDGIGAAAVGLLLSVGYKAVRTSRGAGALCVIFSIIFLVGVLRWPMIPVVLCIAPVSIWLAARASAGEDEDDDEGAAPVRAGPHA